MSLKDDLLRNRDVFEKLTGYQEGAEETGAVEFATPKSQKPLTLRDTETGYESKPLEASNFTVNPQKIEAYSLEHGKAITRESGMALSFTPPEGIEFPALSEGPAPVSADPLESLYRRLEAETRRASQLSREEEY